MSQTNNSETIEKKQETEFDIEDIEFEPIESDLENEEPAEQLDVISVKREDTRGRLALAFLVGFFLIIIIALIISALNEGDKTSSAKEILLTISGILSGPLGFVIGYYFRSSEDS